ncbi:hypothetical protein L873DRAFT_1853870 [Choiromyces venosus 120613-1]|uniref:Uncharacterized protein n=1 Tax=Choiromyces venosus 120613-1 TaxID=1336337 RepID=A0A3N4J8P1_9PEZI|nr:hypothetical protein L873DRAFT_1853870 [Choiromyces venosus 120613-1]
MIFMIHCLNKSDITAYIEQFDELWDSFLQRTSEAMTLSMLIKASHTSTNETLETLVHSPALSCIMKRTFFITFLSISLDNVIDNLTTKDMITYTDISTSPTDIENTAFVTTNKYYYCKEGNKDTSCTITAIFHKKSLFMTLFLSLSTTFL